GARDRRGFVPGGTRQSRGIVFPQARGTPLSQAPVPKWREPAIPAVMLLVAVAREVDIGMRDHLLYELARDLSSSLELDVVLAKVMDRMITLMKASRGVIVLVDPVDGSLPAQLSVGAADPEK